MALSWDDAVDDAASMSRLLDLALLRVQGGRGEYGGRGTRPQGNAPYRGHGRGRMGGPMPGQGLGPGRGPGMPFMPPGMGMSGGGGPFMPPGMGPRGIGGPMGGPMNGHGMPFMPPGFMPGMPPNAPMGGTQPVLAARICLCQVVTCEPQRGRPDS